MTTIIIMEDDFELGDQWHDALTREGYTVRVARNATDAMAIIERFDVDLAIVDLIVAPPLHTGKEGGLSLLRQIRFSDNREIRKMKVIGVSGFKPPSDTSIAESLFKNYNVQSFIEKPVLPHELVEVVIDILAEKKPTIRATTCKTL